LNKQILISLFILLNISQSYANEVSKYTGKWETQDGKRQLVLKDNMHCIFSKYNKVVLKEDICQWNIKQSYNEIIYFIDKERKKFETIYFKLDNNELIFEKDLRSLNRERANMIMDKIQ